MNSLTAQFLPNTSEKPDTDPLNCLMDNLPIQSLDHLLWGTSDYKPVVNFSIGYSDRAIYLKYRVAEKYTKAVYYNTNDPVYKDSCVEFFIAFGNELYHYNLEYNYLGVALVGYGDDKERVLLPVELINNIIAYPVFGADEFKNSLCSWELTLKIPFNIFHYHRITSLKGLNCRGNFYKCGDNLPEPHYLSWNKVVNATPNFHLREFFGLIKFD